MDGKNVKKSIKKFMKPNYNFFQKEADRYIKRVGKAVNYDEETMILIFAQHLDHKMARSETRKKK